MLTLQTGNPILKSACLSLWAISFFNVQKAQGDDNYYIKSYSLSEGIAHERIRAIAQDQCGFMWIGTWDGLCRFDGYQFRNYRHHPGDTNSIPYFSIRKVLVDGVNRVWVFTDHQYLVEYRRTHDDFINPSNFPDSLDARMGVSDISLDSKRNLWVVRTEGLWKCEAMTGEWTFYRVRDSQGGTVRFFAQDMNFLSFGPGSEIWIQNQSVNRAELVNGENNSGHEFHIRQSYAYSTTHLPIYTFDYFYSSRLYRSHTGKVWIVSNQGLQVLDDSLGVFIPYGGVIPRYELPAEQEIWWTDYMKDLYYHIPGRPMIRIPSHISRVGIFAFVDRQQNLWFGNISETGAGLGLHLYYQIPAFFSHYLTEFHDELRRVSIRSVLMDKRDDLWVSTSGFSQVFRIDPEGRIHSHHPLPELLQIPNNGVKSMAEDESGIWMGFQRFQLVHYNPSTRQFSVIASKNRHEEDPSIPDSYHNIVPDSDGSILINYNPVYRYNPKTNRFSRLTQAFIRRDLYFAFYFMERDSLGAYWVGTGDSKLLRYDSEFELRSEYSLSRDRYNLEGMIFGEAGSLWVTSLGSGLINFQPQTGTPRYFTNDDGLSHNTTYSILEDRKGHFWISTNQGISRFDPRTEQFQIFGPQDGLRIVEFNSDAHFQARDGRMFFGGVGGLISFHPDSVEILTSHGAKASFVISDFRVSNIPRHFDTPVHNNQVLHLRKGDNNFQITMALLDFRDADKIRYRYRMLGYQNEWMEVDHLHRTINFTNLHPKTSLLELQASNRNGEWVASMQLNVEIPPYYYQSDWFVIAIAFVVLSTALSILYMYNRQSILGEKHKQEELRMESLKGQMNPHFIFNSLNSINYFISQSDRLAANKYIADFSQLIRSILENASKTYIPLERELQWLANYVQLEHLRFSNKFDYQIESPSPNDIINREIFPGLVQPFIENAIWHGIRPLEERKGQLIVRFQLSTQNAVLCIVEDNGIGRKNASANPAKFNRHKSRGIGIAMDRLQSYNRLHNTHYRIQIEDLDPEKEQCGTRVSVEIPARIAPVESAANY